MRPFLLFVVFALAGCPSAASFRSAVAPDFKGPLTGLYVLAKIGGKDALSPAEFSTRLSALTKQCAVPTMVEVLQDLSLDPDAERVNASIHRLVEAGADKVLVILLRGGTITDGVVTESVYELRLLDLNAERTVWSAAASLNGISRETSLANGLVLQLSNDGVLPKPCAKALDVPEEPRRPG
jgi:hypothetical protein